MSMNDFDVCRKVQHFYYVKREICSSYDYSLDKVKENSANSRLSKWLAKYTNFVNVHLNKIKYKRVQSWCISLKECT